MASFPRLLLAYFMWNNTVVILHNYWNTSHAHNFEFSKKNLIFSYRDSSLNMNSPAKKNAYFILAKKSLSIEKWFVFVQLFLCLMSQVYLRGIYSNHYNKKCKCKYSLSWLAYFCLLYKNYVQSHNRTVV